MIRRRVVAHPGARSDRSQPRRTRCPPPARKMDTCPGRLATSPRASRSSRTGSSTAAGARKDGEPKTRGGGSGRGQGARDVEARARLAEVLLRVREGEPRAGPRPVKSGNASTKGRPATTREGNARGTKRRWRPPLETHPYLPVPSTPSRRPTRPSPPTPLPTPLSRMADTRVTCGVRCGTKANYDAHCDGKKHRSARQRERGRAMLAGDQGGRANRRRRRVSDEDENVL